MWLRKETLHKEEEGEAFGLAFQTFSFVLYQKQKTFTKLLT